ncbi:hypothetical protein ACFSXZ_30140, partial [Amycolatopsis pigmentata]
PGTGAWGSSVPGGGSARLDAGARTGSGPGAAGARPGGALGGAAAGRAASSPGMPGMGGQGRGGGEDTEHRGRGLVKHDWEDDLVGNLPPHVPSVIDCGPDGYEDE